MGAEQVTLGRLATVTAGQLVGPADVEINDVTHDSRSAGPGDLFVAIRGSNRDGHDFIAGANASAACVEDLADVALPQIVVADTRRVLPLLAAEVHGHPSRRLDVVGVTGTNGKTTVTHMLASVVSASGRLPGVVGTVGARIGDDRVDIERTSPEATDFQRLLARMVAKKVQVAAVEVSSNAVVLGRVDATEFRVVAFTNLSQDHLDFHTDMEEYFAAKARLFTDGAGSAVICVDEVWGRRLVELTDRDVITTGSRGIIRARSLVDGLEMSRFDLVTPEGAVPIELPIGGSFNVSNALVAAGCARVLGLSLEAIGTGLMNMEPIPGRMEVIDAGQEFRILVDYAHTPDGINEVLDTVRPLVAGRTLVVVGAGGDRDQAKRPAMGEAVSRADVAFITSDNPRTEDPAEIVAQVAAGAGEAAELVLEPNRRTAIEMAISIAEAGDVVLILGKGHEPGQEIGGRVIPFDDRVVAREAVIGA